MKPLNPIMAALLAAVSATFASPRFASAAEAAAGGAVTTPPGTAVSTDPDALTALAGLIKTSDPAKAGVSARIQKYVLDANLKFANDAARASANVQKEVASETNKWIGVAPTNAAYLFYVLSFTQPAPDWVKGNASLQKMFGGGGDTRDLQACLNDNLTKGSKSQVGKIAETTTVAGAVGNFLIAAGTGAKGVLLNCNQVQRSAIEKTVKDNQNGPSAPVVPGSSVGNGNGGGAGPGDPLATNKVYGLKDLYVSGAIVVNIYRDAKDGYRTLSIKRQWVPQTDGTVKQMVAIVDITNPGTVFAPTYVGMPLSGKTTVTVYGGKPDGSAVSRNYDLLANFNQISISRPGSTLGAPGTATFTNADLGQRLAAQAAAQGTSSFGGTNYHVLGQGGKSGVFLFFDNNGLLTGKPAFVSASVNVVDASGNWNRYVGKPNLIPVGADPSAQWHLEWADPGHWSPVSGPGDVPGGTTPTPPPAASTTTAPGGQPGGDPSTNPPTTTSAATPAACNGAQCSTYNDAFTGRDANADFTPASSGRLHLLRGVAGGVTTYYIVFGKNEIKGNRNTLTFSSNQPPGLVGVRGYKDSLALEIKTGSKLEVQYLPIQLILDNFNTGAKLTYDDFDTDTVKSASNLAVALDMINTYLKTPVKDASGKSISKASAVATITERANKFIAKLGGQTYTVGGTLDIAANPFVVYGAKSSWQVWPKDAAFSAGGNPNPADANLSGPGTVGDLSTGGDAGMPDDGLDIGGDVKVYRKDAQKGPDAGLYQAASTKDWYLFLRIARDGGVGRSPAIKLGGPIASWMKNPSAVGLQGLASISPALPVNSPPLQFIGTAGKGAYVAYRYAVPAADGSNVKDKKGNCAGPVIWFGVDQPTAQKACVAGHF